MLEPHHRERRIVSNSIFTNTIESLPQQPVFHFKQELIFLQHQWSKEGYNNKLWYRHAQTAVGSLIYERERGIR